MGDVEMGEHTLKVRHIADGAWAPSRLPEKQRMANLVGYCMLSMFIVDVVEGVTTVGHVVSGREAMGVARW